MCATRQICYFHHQFIYFFSRFYIKIFPHKPFHSMIEIYKLYTFDCTDCFGAMVEIAFILPVVLQYVWDIPNHQSPMHSLQHDGQEKLHRLTEAFRLIRSQLKLFSGCRSVTKLGKLAVCRLGPQLILTHGLGLLQDGNSRL